MKSEKTPRRSIPRVPQRGCGFPAALSLAAQAASCLPVSGTAPSMGCVETGICITPMTTFRIHSQK